MEVPLDLQLPVYNIVSFTEKIYKIVKFNRSFGDLPHLEKHEEYDEKLSQSFSRARATVLDLGLCNNWDYFFTGTLDPKKYDRRNLAKFHKDLTQWIRDKRKVYGTALDFLLVPEPHADGCWHVHGFIAGIPRSALSPFDPSRHPLRLCNRGYLNWDDYAMKFGFCSLAPIKDPFRVAWYMCKYVSKELSSRASELGAHLYYCSRGLNRSRKCAEVFYSSAELDRFLSHHYKFCSTGFSKPADGLDWTFPLIFDENIPPLVPADLEDFSSSETRKIDRMIEAVEQLSFGGGAL